METEHRAEELKTRGLRLLASPAALVLPRDVRALIADLLALVAELAKGRA